VWVSGKGRQIYRLINGFVKWEMILGCKKVPAVDNSAAAA